MMQIQQTGDRWSVRGDVIIGSVNALLEASQQFVLKIGTIVDFKDVGNVDTSAIGLILEWKRRAKRENCTLELVNMPENLKSLAALYGVSDIVN